MNQQEFSMIPFLLCASVWPSIALFVGQDPTAGAAKSTTKPLVLRTASGAEFAAEESRLRVPERHESPSGKTIELAFIRVISSASSPGAPTIFLNGGPGQAATPIASNPAALSEWERLLAVGDVVFLDQRGTGSSTPALTYAPATRPKLPREFFADHALARKLVLESQRETKAHFDAAGVDLTAYNTEESADDVDDVRASLRVEQVNLLGFSYGTLLAQTVLRRHASHVKRAVLVGTEGPRDWGSLPSIVEGQIHKISLLAARDSNVNHAVPDFHALLGQVLERLEEHPLVVQVTDYTTHEQVELLLGRWGLEFLLRIDLGDGNDIPLFPALLWTIDQGRTDVVSRVLEKRYNQLSNGGASGMAQAMRFAYGPTPAMRAQIESERHDCLFRTMDNYFDLDQAAIWNLPRHADGFRSPIVTDVPALFVSGTLDVNAPPHQAEFVRFGFEGSVHLIVENAGHEDMLGNEDVLAVIASFLEGEDVHDARVALAAPSFVGIKRTGR